MFLVVAYDVPAERTEKYRKLLARYLAQLQYSVFAGDVTETLYRKLRRDIDDLYKNNDHLVFMCIENRRNVQVLVIRNGQEQEDSSHLGSAVF